MILKTQRKITLLRCGLISLALICLNGCARYQNELTFPRPKPEVADELEEKCLECPAVWEWIGRLEKLQNQMGN